MNATWVVLGQLLYPNLEGSLVGKMPAKKAIRLFEMCN